MSSPRASEHVQRTYTESQTRLASELNRRKLNPDLEHGIERPGEKSKDGHQKGFYPDLWFPQLLVVEVDGEGHDFDSDPQRDKWLVENGHAKKVLHLEKDFVLRHTGEAATRVQDALDEIAGKPVPKVNPEYEKMLPKMPKEEYEALKASIQSDGQHYSIVINNDWVILDGHHRYQACRELGLSPRYEFKSFTDGLLEKRFVIISNLKRRHLEAWQRFQLGKMLVPIYEAEALERERSGRRVDPVQPVGQGPVQGRTLERVGREVGLSDETLRQAIYVDQRATPEQVKKIETGDSSIKNTYLTLSREEKLEREKDRIKTLPPLEGIFEVVVVDPPWPYGGMYDPTNHRVGTPYPEMSLDEIKAMSLPLAETAVVWLWTTNYFMRDAYEVLEYWGLEPKTILTWVKDKMGVGEWLRGQTEHCILAVRGKPMVNLTNQTTALLAKTRGHSVKPDEFYDLVNSLCVGRKVDIFGRKSRDGWVVHGITSETP